MLGGQCESRCRDRPAFHGVAPPFRAFGLDGIDLWVHRSHFAVFGGLVVFPSNQVTESVKFSAAVSRRLVRSFEVCPVHHSPRQSHGAPLLRSFPLQHIKAGRSGTRGFSRPAIFRPQGFGTLSAVCALPTPARSVSRGRRSWGSPLGGFLSRKVARPLDRPEPTRRLQRKPLQSVLRSLLPCPTSGLSPSREPVAQSQGFSPPPRSLLPWALAL
jgi:hypothetical protein